MKYVSIDLETTGLDWYKCQILQFSAVIEDTSKPDVKVEDLPSFTKILYDGEIRGEPYALTMNKDIIEAIAKGNDNIISSGDLAFKFKKFLEDNDIDPLKVTVAGKNFAMFDNRFLEKLPGFKGFGDLFLEIKFKHRVIDVGSMFFNPLTDDDVPNLRLCLERSGYSHDVAHDAEKDAKDVIRCIRFKSLEKLNQLKIK